MIERLHGIDRHVKFSTISVLDRQGVEIKFISRCTDIEDYCKTLGPEDLVAVESSGGVFHLADMIETTGAKVCVIDPRRFKIICESKRKTDKNDARLLARGLYWMMTGNEILPMVYKPDQRIRTLRRLFGVYVHIQKQITALKNAVQGYLRDIGISLKKGEKEKLFDRKRSQAALTALGFGEMHSMVLSTMLEPLHMLLEKKETIAQTIITEGSFLQKEVELLLTIRGMSPLLALAFLADVGDIRRFRSKRRLCAYLGVVPSTDSSGGKTRHGKIIKESRKLTRTLFTQAMRHFLDSSASFKNWYTDLAHRRGTGRARIAGIRKIVSVMRCMLLTNEPYRTMEEKLTGKKVRDYRRIVMVPLLVRA
jgi:transposase